MSTASRRRRAGLLDALPPYLGGKRKLLGRIFKALPRPAETPVLIDAFLGGGAVSLMAKARGFLVRCNDVALRAAIVGRALIVNDRIAVAHEDVLRLFAADAPEPPGFIEREFGGDVLPVHHARFLDRALPHALRMSDTRGALLQLLLIRYVMALRPMGNFGAKSVMRQMDEGAWDEVNPSVLRDRFTARLQGHPLALCEELRERINAGVFSNGKTNTVHQGDVFDFLAEVEGDVVYLDPPYGGTVAYETALRPLDSILEGRMVETPPSMFSGRQALDWLDRLLAACRRFPHLVLSYGNAAATPEQVEGVVARHRRDVRMEVLRYEHLRSLANVETKKENREILIAAGAARR